MGIVNKTKQVNKEIETRVLEARSSISYGSRIDLEDTDQRKIARTMPISSRVILARHHRNYLILCI